MMVQQRKGIVPAFSWIVMVAVGVLSTAMGVLFVLLRPLIVLLPEDQRYTGLSPDQFKVLDAELFSWAGMVFRSWGAFAIGIGILIVALAWFGLRKGEQWVWWALLCAGVTTFGIFLTVNIFLDSDFMWVIATLLGFYVAALYVARPSRK